MNTISRRSLGQGAAWSVPVILAAGVVPAMAASPAVEPPKVMVAGRVSWNVDWNSTRLDYQESFKVYSIVPDTVRPGQGYRVINSKSSTAIGPMTITFYIPTAYPDTVFHTVSGSNNGWTLLTQDRTKRVKYEGRTAFYPFTTKYSAKLPARDGTTFWPSFRFESASGLPLYADHYYVDHQTTLDGKEVNLNYNRVSLSGA